MRRTSALVITALLCLSLAAPARAAIKIKKISFDPAGRDDGTNRNLNKEWIYVVNTGPNDIQLKDWKIVDQGRDHVYKFSVRLFLFAGDTIKLHTGRGSDGAPVCEQGQPCPDNAHYDLYWKLDSYVWNKTATAPA